MTNVKHMACAILLLLFACCSKTAAPPNNGRLSFVVSQKTNHAFEGNRVGITIQSAPGVRRIKLDAKGRGQRFLMLIERDPLIPFGSFCATSNHTQKWVEYSIYGRMYRAVQYSGKISRYSHGTMDITFDALLQSEDGEQVRITNGKATNVVVKEVTNDRQPATDNRQLTTNQESGVEQR